MLRTLLRGGEGDTEWGGDVFFGYDGCPLVSKNEEVTLSLYFAVVLVLVDAVSLSLLLFVLPMLLVLRVMSESLMMALNQWPNPLNFLLDFTSFFSVISYVMCWVLLRSLSSCTATMSPFFSPTSSVLTFPCYLPLRARSLFFAFVLLLLCPWNMFTERKIGIVCDDFPVCCRRPCVSVSASGTLTSCGVDWHTYTHTHTHTHTIAHTYP